MKLIHKDLQIREMQDWEIMDVNDVELFEINMYQREALNELKSELHLDSNHVMVVRLEGGSPAVLSKMNFNLGMCDCCSDSNIFNNKIIGVDVYEI